MFLKFICAHSLSCFDASLFRYQDEETGRLPFAGPSTGSFNKGAKSDTYHAWAVIGVYNYFLYTGDVEFVQDVWANYVSKINALGLPWTEFTYFRQRPSGSWRTSSSRLD